jgi:3-oxoacyl-[acyl-carrier protein] reductase
VKPEFAGRLLQVATVSSGAICGELKSVVRSRDVERFGDLTGRCAVVTGSSSGIGRAIALELARGGANVAVHCVRSIDAAKHVAAAIEALGRKCAVLQADLGDEQGLSRFVDNTWRALGGVDVWVNNAGADLLTGAGARLAYSEKLRRLLEVDVRATALLSRLAGVRMRDAGSGVLLNIGWDQADRGMEGESGELFAAAKNAVMGLTRSLALSLAPHVRVNCIAPGWIRTAWGEQAGAVWQERVLRETPLCRWGTPEDIARLARFLASDDAAYITGQVINANGGAVR